MRNRFGVAPPKGLQRVAPTFQRTRNRGVRFWNILSVVSPYCTISTTNCSPLWTSTVDLSIILFCKTMSKTKKKRRVKRRKDSPHKLSVRVTSENSATTVHCVHRKHGFQRNFQSISKLRWNQWFSLAGRVWLWVIFAPTLYGAGVFRISSNLFTSQKLLGIPKSARSRSIHSSKIASIRVNTSLATCSNKKSFYLT